MRPLSADILEKIVTASREGVTGQVAKGMYKHLVAEKRWIKRKRGILASLSDCTVFFRAESGSVLWKQEMLGKKKLSKSLKMSFFPSSTIMRGSLFQMKTSEWLSVNQGVGCTCDSLDPWTSSGQDHYTHGHGSFAHWWTKWGLSIYKTPVQPLSPPVVTSGPTKDTSEPLPLINTDLRGSTLVPPDPELPASGCPPVALPLAPPLSVQMAPSGPLPALPSASPEGGS